MRARQNGGAPPNGTGGGCDRPRERYSMGDLEAATGLNGRTIRFYVSQGLLPPAHGRGPSATYDRGHLLRLRAIQQLKAGRMPLDEIKGRLAELADDEIATLLAVEAAPSEERVLWRRIELHPGIEVHVRERAGAERDPRFEQMVSTVLAAARSIVAEFEPRS